MMIMRAQPAAVDPLDEPADCNIFQWKRIDIDDVFESIPAVEIAMLLFFLEKAILKQGLKLQSALAPPGDPVVEPAWASQISVLCLRFASSSAWRPRQLFACCNDIIVIPRDAIFGFKTCKRR